MPAVSLPEVNLARQTRQPASFLPMSRQEMQRLGWDACDIVLVTGDAYVDHPSFGMAVIGRVLEAQGFRVGIIAQPDWRSKADFQRLGQPKLFFGVTAGNMDSMINRYTAERRLRSDDAYTPNGEGGKRPDRAVVVYAQRCREAFSDVPVIIGGIEASLRRIAHYDYWSDKVRRSVLPDSKADMLLYGNAENAIVSVAKHLAAGGLMDDLSHLRGTAVMRRELPADFALLDSTELDVPGRLISPVDPYQSEPGCGSQAEPDPVEGVQVVRIQNRRYPRERTCVRLPDYEAVSKDPVLYAHASRVMHLETNPHNARALVQRHGDREVWVNPPPLPLATAQLDGVFDLPYARAPHPSYGKARIPAWEMIRFSINIMRGCFGGCSFCSITEHEGRIIQNRSERSILREVEAVRDRVQGFTGTISDLGGPTANMYRLACKDPKIEAACRRLSCVYPGICENMSTDHRSLTQLYRKARALPGVKRVMIASGLRYDLAVEDPEYLRELVTHHVGGYLKIAPEHTEEGPLSKMMKPGMGTYYRFKKMFERFSREAGKEQYLIPYFISAHPGSEDVDMVNLALWLKSNKLKLDQVQNFIPSPLCNATTMYHSGRNPLKKVGRQSEQVSVPKGGRQRRLQKALLRYHDSENWSLIREALLKMGRRDLIGRGPNALVPPAGGSESRGRSGDTGSRPPMKAGSRKEAKPGENAARRSVHKGAAKSESQSSAKSVKVNRRVGQKGQTANSKVSNGSGHIASSKTRSKGRSDRRR